jgi:myo-inositol-1(or 4)-monophosphatase
MTADQERALLAVAEAAADAAANELRLRYGTNLRGVHTKSTPTDLVSEADVLAERAIRRVLAEHRPDDAILGEEGGATEGSGGGGADAIRWIVDPLDGTINYLYGIPAFAVSVACEDAAGTIAGIVLDPIREECFAATRSGPPTLNGEPIAAGDVTDLSVAMVATGFGYDAAVRARQADVLREILPRVRDIRRVGAAALDLVWCACGRFDAYYERGVHSWDIAAGALIAERAGLVVRELPEAEDVGDPYGIVAAPPALLDELYALASGRG